MSYHSQASSRVPSAFGLARGGTVETAYALEQKHGPQTGTHETEIRKAKERRAAYLKLPVASSGRNYGTKCVPDNYFGGRWRKEGEAYHDTYGNKALYHAVARRDFQTLCDCINTKRDISPRYADGYVNFGVSHPCDDGRGKPISDAECEARIAPEVGRAGSQQRVDWCWTTMMQRHGRPGGWPSGDPMPPHVSNEAPRLPMNRRVVDMPNPCNPLHIPAPCSEVAKFNNAATRSRGHTNVSLRVERQPVKVSWIFNTVPGIDRANRFLRPGDGGERFVKGEDHSPTLVNISNDDLRELKRAREYARGRTAVKGIGASEVNKKATIGLAAIGGGTAVLFGVVYLLTRKS